MAKPKQKTKTEVEDPRTQTELKTEITNQQEALASLQAAYNKKTRDDIVKRIGNVKTSLDTLAGDDGFKLSSLTESLVKLVNLTIGKDKMVVIVDKATPAKFDWKELKAKLKAKGITSKTKSKSRKEIEEIYFDSNKTTFNQKFNDKKEKEKYLDNEGSLANTKYWSK